MFSKSHGGLIQIVGELRKNLWGRHLMLWGIWEKVKTVGELKKSWGAQKIHGGAISWGLLQRGVCNQHQANKR